MSEKGTEAKAEEHRVIAGTRRADGTQRKARRVRAGYVAPDEQRKYTTPAQRRQQDKQHEQAARPKAPADKARLPAEPVSEEGNSARAKYVPPFLRKRMAGKEA
ncbi:hypothetical protein IWW55_001559, partial [Coemansia sp. RSA 2706]